MMKYIYTMIAVLFLGLTFMSNRAGRATSQNLGSTGAPKEQTVCKSCHNGPINVAVKLHLLDGSDTVTAWEPNKNYTIRVFVQHTGGNVPKGYGFQLTGLQASLNVDGPSIQTISPASSNVKTGIAQGRLYAEHSDRSLSPVFDINWTAPESGFGAITFYAAGNGVNSDNNLTGDGSSKIAIQFNEKITSSTNRAFANRGINLYPNPTSESTFVKDESNLVHKVVIRDLLGKLVKTEILDSYKKSIYLSEMQDGVYMVQFFTKDSQLLKTQRLVKRNVRP
ncbi:MAG: T9SS type A sorting domain-containing protein [Saprospiraceae bacterium]|nr:T9SS type A sorting domain-containing protein [Saprospiraceae bacterium]